MAANKTKGKRAVSLELDEVLIGRAKEFARERGDTLSATIEAALARHMANPPPTASEVPLPPVPVPVPAPAPTAPAKGKRK